MRQHHFLQLLGHNKNITVKEILNSTKTTEIQRMLCSFSRHPTVPHTRDITWINRTCYVVAEYHGYRPRIVSKQWLVCCETRKTARTNPLKPRKRCQCYEQSTLPQDEVYSERRGFYKQRPGCSNVSSTSWIRTAASKKNFKDVYSSCDSAAIGYTTTMLHDLGDPLPQPWRPVQRSAYTPCWLPHSHGVNEMQSSIPYTVFHIPAANKYGCLSTT